MKWKHIQEKVELKRIPYINKIKITHDKYESIARVPKQVVKLKDVFPLKYSRKYLIAKQHLP